VKYYQTGARVRPVLLFFLSSLFWAMGARAQGDSASQLSTFQIFREYGRQFIAFKGAALSPDGKQVAAAYFGHVDAGPKAELAFRVEIWNVGTQEPIASKQLYVTVPEVPISVSLPGPEGFVQYCDHGFGIMITDPSGTFYYLNSRTLEVIHTTETKDPIFDEAKDIPRRAYCAANSPRAVIAYGGSFLSWDYPNIAYYGRGNGIVRVYDLTSGTLLRDWDTTEGPNAFGDVAISPSGNQIAVSHIPRNPGWRTKTETSPSVPSTKDTSDLEVFDVDSGKMTLQVDTGRWHWPGRISFAGETQIASDDTRMVQPLYPQPRIKLWDSSNGKLIREFADRKSGARRFVGASSSGHVILGYIPRERARSGRWNETVEERFRLWDAATGSTIATSPRFSPHPDAPSKRWNEPVDPSMELSDDGRAVIVYWKKGVFRIYVFSLPPAAPPQPH
jgi:WD40 repeat protein